MYWPDEAIRLLKSGRVDEISLDHDLGDDRRGTGYDVILWIEEAVVTKGFTPPRVINVHSANSSAAHKMRQGIEQIYKLHKRFSRVGRIATRYLHANRPPNTIAINVWDDSPPGAPLYIEGHRDELWKLWEPPDKAALYSFLAGIAVGAGYEVGSTPGGGWYDGWKGANRVIAPKVLNPAARKNEHGEAIYDDAVDNRDHTAFLHDLVALYSGKSFGHYQFYVYSES